MSVMVRTIIENASFIAIFLLCLHGILSVRAHTKTVPGADLLLIGLLLYASYAILAWGVAGFNGSFFVDWSGTPVLNGESFTHFLAYALRLGLIFIVVGIFKVGRGLKA